MIASFLARQKRDIQLNLCQYGMAEVWKWGAETGQSWRVGGDLGHTIMKNGVYDIARKTIRIREHNGPSSWNDPDYLILGKWVSPFDKASPPTPVKLTPNEQYSLEVAWRHSSLFSPAPSCPGVHPPDWKPTKSALLRSRS